MPNASPRPPTVLVVDDDERNRSLVRAFLTANSYNVDEASNGAECLRAFDPSRHDLVLLDVMMPGMDGFETCRQLRVLPGGRDIPIVFLTCLSDSEVCDQAIAAGADDFLAKPIQRTELLLRARSLIRIRYLQEELRNGYELILSQRNALALLQLESRWGPNHGQPILPEHDHLTPDRSAKE